jgi:uncharacterized membrane protein YjjP (DUF1212 family)
LTVTLTSNDASGFVLRLGRSLQAYGYPAHSLEDVLSAVSRTLGLSAQFFSTPTALFAAFGPIEEQRTHLIRIQPGEVNLGKLALLHEVMRDVRDGCVEPGEGSRRVDAITAAAPPYNRLAQVMAYGVASAAGCRFLGGGMHEVPVALGIGLAIGLLSLTFRRMSLPVHVFELAATFAASAIVSLLAASGFTLSTFIATLAGIIIILPGLTMTVAMTELASRHLASGTSRLAAAFIVFIAMGFGVTLGSTLVTELYGAVRSSAPIRLAPWTLWLALGAAPLGFAVLLKARPRDIPWIFVTSLAGYAGMRLGTPALGADLGAALGSLAVGLASGAYERWGRGPAPVVMVPGVLLLVPGSIGYKGLSSVLNDNVVVGLSGLVDTVMIAVALAAGLIVASVILPAQRQQVRR